MVNQLYYNISHSFTFPFFRFLRLFRSVGRSLGRCQCQRKCCTFAFILFFVWRVYCCNLHLHWTSKRLFSIHTFVLSIVAIVYMCVCECVFFSAGNIECRQTGRYSSIVCSCLMLCCLSTKEKLGNPKNSIKFIIKSEYVVNGFLCPFSQFWERSFPLASMLTHTHTNAWLLYVSAICNLCVGNFYLQDSNKACHSCSGKFLTIWWVRIWACFIKSVNSLVNVDLNMIGIGICWII